MHVPTVTDEMLEKVLEIAASPVFVLFVEADDAESARVGSLAESAADDWDDRVIFLKTFADENPGVSRLRNVARCPTAVLYRKSAEIARIDGDFSQERLNDIFEKTCGA